MLSALMKNIIFYTLKNETATWKASIPFTILLSPRIYQITSRKLYVSCFAFYTFFICASLICSWIQFASTLQANLLNRDAFSQDMSPAKSQASLLASTVTSKTSLPSNITYSPPKNVPENIPRVIHRMWRNLASNPPDEWIIARESCHEKNPFYEQYVWNDETAHQFIEAHFTWFLPTYTTYLLPPQRVDALRYLLLWHFGGIYLDPEIGCQLSIEPLLHDVTALLPQNWPYGVSQRMIASRANHPFVIKVALDITDHGHSWPKHATAMFSTGPIIISRVLARWFRAMRESPDITILPLEIFVGEKGAFFMSHEPQIPPGDEFSIFQFVLENPIGWGGAALALGVMSTVIFGVSMRSKSIRDQTSTSLIV